MKKKSKYQKYIDQEIAQGPPDPIEILNTRIRQTIERCPTCELDPENGIPNDLCSSCAEEVGRVLMHDASRLGRMVVDAEYLGWMEPKKRLQCLQDVRENFRRLAWDQAHDLLLTRTSDFVNQHPMVALLDIEIDRQRRTIEEGRKADKSPQRRKRTGQQRTVKIKTDKVDEAFRHFSRYIEESDHTLLRELLNGDKRVTPRKMAFKGIQARLHELLTELNRDGLWTFKEDDSAHVPMTEIARWAVECFTVKGKNGKREKPSESVLRKP